MSVFQSYEFKMGAQWSSEPALEEPGYEEEDDLGITPLDTTLPVAPVLSEAEALAQLQTAHGAACKSGTAAAFAFETAQSAACEALLRGLPTLATPEGNDADASHAERTRVLVTVAAWLGAGYVSMALTEIVRADVVECASREIDGGKVAKRTFLQQIKAWQGDGLLNEGAFDAVKARTIAALVARKGSGNGGGGGAAAAPGLSSGSWRWNWHAAADRATFEVVDRRRESGHAKAALDLLVAEWSKHRSAGTCDVETECAFKWRIARGYVELTEWRGKGRALESQIKRAMRNADESRTLCATAAGTEAWAASLPPREAHAWAESEKWWGLAAGLMIQHGFVKSGWDRKAHLVLGGEIQQALENAAKLWEMVDPRGDPLTFYALGRLHFEYAQLGALAQGLSALGVVLPRSTYDDALAFCIKSRDGTKGWGLQRHNPSNVLLATRCRKQAARRKHLPTAKAAGSAAEKAWLILACPLEENCRAWASSPPGAELFEESADGGGATAAAPAVVSIAVPAAAPPAAAAAAAARGQSAEWARPVSLPMSPEEIRDETDCSARLQEILRNERGEGGTVMCCGGIADLFSFNF